MHGFHLQATGEKVRHFSPSANSCFRQNNKRLNDIVSCPLGLQSGNGTTSLRQQLQMAHLYNSSLSLSGSLNCASTETLVDLKDRLISIESCWSVLKRQSISTDRGRARWKQSNEKTENKLWGHLGWTNTHKATSTVKCTHTRSSPHHVKSWFNRLLPSLTVVSFGLLLLEQHESHISTTHTIMSIRVVAAETLLLTWT